MCWFTFLTHDEIMNVYFTNGMTSSEVSFSNIQKSLSFSSSTQINTDPSLDLGPKRKQTGHCEGQIKSKVPGKL